MVLGGKRDESLILPTNDSISTTLDTNQVNNLKISKSNYKILKFSWQDIFNILVLFSS